MNGSDTLKRRHEFEAWRGRNLLAEDLFVWRYFLAGRELEGRRLMRAQAVETPDWPRSVQSLWEPLNGTRDDLIRLDVFECSSRPDAHELVLQVLAEAQSPQLERDEQADVGDVAFAPPGHSAVFFARANLVVVLRNAGPRVVPLLELARRYDESLTEQPRPGGAVVPEIASLRVREGEPGGRATLDVDVRDPLGRPVLFKFYTIGGTVQVEDDTPVLVPSGPGPATVTLFVVNENGGVASQTLRHG